MSPDKTFKLTMSERCFRFKPDALPNHAPHQPGVYEFVTFDAQMKPIVLYVGLALPPGPSTIFDALSGHMLGEVKPSSEELFKAAKDIYFDYVAAADITHPEDFKDIAGALQTQHKPRFNTEPAPASGKYAAVKLAEVG